MSAHGGKRWPVFLLSGSGIQHFYKSKAKAEDLLCRERAAPLCILPEMTDFGTIKKETGLIRLKIQK